MKKQAKNLNKHFSKLKKKTDEGNFAIYTIIPN